MEAGHYSVQLLLANTSHTAFPKRARQQTICFIPLQTMTTCFLKLEALNQQLLYAYIY